MSVPHVLFTAAVVLVLSVVGGLAAAGLTAAIRVGVQDHIGEAWLLRKPLSCDLCMSFWGSVAAVGGFALSESVSLISAMLAVFGSVGVSLVAVKAASRLSA